MPISNVLNRVATTASDLGRRTVDQAKTVAQPAVATAEQTLHAVSSFDPRPSSTPPSPPQHHSTAPLLKPSQLRDSLPAESPGGTARTPKKAVATLHEKFVPVPAADVRALNAATADRGVIGTAEAARARQKAEALPSAERAQFQALVDGASNATEKVFLYKALASGHSVAEIATFDRTIHGWKAGNGVKQQYGDTCAPTTAQALRGEFDPIYALAVRSSNKDVNKADDAKPDATNTSLGKEQADLLTGPGRGTTTTREAGTGGTANADATDAVINSMSTWTGYRYASDPSGTTDQKLDRVAAQLEKGIATPMRVADAKNNGHIVLATAVDGSGPTQRFLIHDPWSGDTGWVTRKQFETGDFDFAGHSQLSSVSTAFPQ
jgi:hypothetical protein